MSTVFSGCIFCRKITMEFVFTFFNHTINFVSLPFLRRPMIFPVCFSHFSEEFICSVYFLLNTLCETWAEYCFPLISF